MAKCRIYETFKPTADMTPGTSKHGLMTMSGVFGECGKRNRNNRIYVKENYANMIHEMQERIKQDGGVCGELEHPATMSVTLENVSHKITEVNIDENGTVTGTLELLNTPKGKIAQAIVESGMPLYVSSRAMGTIDKNGVVTLEKLSTYDIVSTPGVANARITLNESAGERIEQIDENTFVVIESEDDNSSANTINEDNMEYKEILEKLEGLERRIGELEDENASLRESLESISETQRLDPEQVKSLADGIQKWVVEEFAPEVQNWITEEFAPAQESRVSESFRQDFTQNIAPLIQQWILEEYSPEVQGWVVEEFAPQVQHWILEEYSPAIQSWVVDEYSPEVQNWMNESYMDSIRTEVKGIVNEAKKNSVSSIDETLRLLESLAPKPGQKPAPEGARVTLNEAHVDPSEPLYLQKMPESMRPLWNQASQEVKESVSRRARIYNFTREGAFEKFWESIDLENITPAKNVFEGLDNVYDEKEKALRMALRRKNHVNLGLR